MNQPSVRVLEQTRMRACEATKRFAKKAAASAIHGTRTYGKAIALGVLAAGLMISTIGEGILFGRTPDNFLDWRAACGGRNSYAKRGRQWTKAYQETEGMKWNYYLVEHRTTPLFEKLELLELRFSMESRSEQARERQEVDEIVCGLGAHGIVGAIVGSYEHMSIAHLLHNGAHSILGESELAVVLSAHDMHYSGYGIGHIDRQDHEGNWHSHAHEHHGHWNHGEEHQDHDAGIAALAHLRPGHASLAGLWHVGGSHSGVEHQDGTHQNEHHSWHSIVHEIHHMIEHLMHMIEHEVHAIQHIIEHINHHHQHHEGGHHGHGLLEAEAAMHPGSTHAIGLYYSGGHSHGGHGSNHEDTWHLSGLSHHALDGYHKPTHHHEHDEHSNSHPNEIHVEHTHDEGKTHKDRHELAKHSPHNPYDVMHSEVHSPFEGYGELYGTHQTNNHTIGNHEYVVHISTNSHPLHEGLAGEHDPVWHQTRMDEHIAHESAVQSMLHGNEVRLGHEDRIARLKVTGTAASDEPKG